MTLKKTGSINHGEKIISSPGFIMLKVEYSTIRMNLDDILYIEGLKDYVKIFSGGRAIRIVIGKERIPIGESYKVPFFNIINRNLI